MLDLEYEIKEYQRTGRIVIGIDEVGRGAWAGPLVLAASAITTNHRSYLHNHHLSYLNDSKKLSKKKRFQAATAIRQQEKKGIVKNFIVERSAIYISEFGLSEALNTALTELVQIADDYFHRKTFFVLDGGLSPQNVSVDYENIIKGDSKIYSIAAAANLAKVYRDDYMTKLSKEYPEYSFEFNVGYGTKAHKMALDKYGVIEEHRTNYKPVLSSMVSRV